MQKGKDSRVSTASEQWGQPNWRRGFSQHIWIRLTMILHIDKSSHTHQSSKACIKLACSPSPDQVNCDSTCSLEIPLREVHITIHNQSDESPTLQAATNYIKLPPVDVCWFCPFVCLNMCLFLRFEHMQLNQNCVTLSFVLIISLQWDTRMHLYDLCEFVVQICSVLFVWF